MNVVPTNSSPRPVPLELKKASVVVLLPTYLSYRMRLRRREGIVPEDTMHSQAPRAVPTYSDQPYPLGDLHIPRISGLTACFCSAEI